MPGRNKKQKKEVKLGENPSVEKTRGRFRLKGAENDLPKITPNRAEKSLPPAIEVKEM